jgi:ribosome-associated translation inhibitor RaiA/cold shock CspA family protein
MCNWSSSQLRAPASLAACCASTAASSPSEKEKPPIGKAGEFVNDWLRRTSLPASGSSAQRLVELPGSWWVYRPNFRGNIGSFGGGDIAVVAGAGAVEAAPDAAAVDARIRTLAAKLERYCDQITRCRVTVEQTHKHHQHGNHYRVRVDVTVPDQALVAAREPSEHHAHVDVYVALRDAFDAMRRQLQDYRRRQRGEVKIHQQAPSGYIAELFPAKDFGRIATDTGRLLYFHRNSLANGAFDQLTTGDEVRFHEEQGDEGPQASAVHLTGKRHVEA